MGFFFLFFFIKGPCLAYDELMNFLFISQAGSWVSLPYCTVDPPYGDF